jgi:hypothetical protein
MTDDRLESLITRDPEAMEHDLEDAEYAGAAPGGETALDGLDVNLGGAPGLNATGLATADPARSGHLNPGYTPPGQMVPAHPSEGRGDLEPGSPLEDQLERGE